METVQTWIHYQATINDLKAQNAKLVAALKAVRKFTRCGEESDWETVEKQVNAVLKELGE